VQLKRADGTLWWASVSAAYLSYQGEPAVFAAFHDVTESKQRIEELKRRTAQLVRTDAALQRARDEHQQLADVIEFLPVAVAITNKSTGVVLYANDHHAKLYGFEHGSDLVGQSMAHFYTNTTERQKLLQRLEQQDHIANYELKRQRADGTAFDLEAQFHNIVYDGQEAIFAVVTDISERKRLDEELEER